MAATATTATTSRANDIRIDRNRTMPKVKLAKYASYLLWGIVQLWSKSDELRPNVWFIMYIQCSSIICGIKMSLVLFIRARCRLIASATPYLLMKMSKKNCFLLVLLFFLLLSCLLEAMVFFPAFIAVDAINTDSFSAKYMPFGRSNFARCSFAIGCSVFFHVRHLFVDCFVAGYRGSRVLLQSG